MVARVGIAEATTEVPMTMMRDKGNDDDTVVIKLATYNIRSGRAGNLESALRAIEKMKVDIAVFTESKLTDSRHTKRAFGYEVVATEAPSMWQGGVVLAF